MRKIILNYARSSGTQIRTKCDRTVFVDLPNPSGRTMALGSTQPLTEMSTRNLLKKKKKTGGKVRRARGTDNLTAIC
jgi:hypothetical protein